MISILIPYFGDRSDLLARSLYMLDNQTIKEPFEVLIIHDGGSPDLKADKDMKLDKMILSISFTRLILATTSIDYHWRTPNYALKYGYEQCHGDFIIVTSPEILIPYNALEVMLQYAHNNTVLAPILYRISKKNQKLLDVMNWKKDLEWIKTMPGFWEDETQPGGIYNKDAEGMRHHGCFVGAKREIWDEIKFIADDIGNEENESDAYWHRRLGELNKLPFPLPIEVYHQWHPRKDEPRKSTRIKRLEEQNG